MSYGEVIENSAQRLRNLRERGGTAIGYLYPHIPIELFLAHGLTPSLIRTNPSTSAGFEDSLQTFSCAFTRNVFSQRANGLLTDFSGVLFPGNTCDALQNVGDVWRKRFTDDRILRLTYPVSTTDASISFLAEELRLLSATLENVFGKAFSATEYDAAVGLVNDFKANTQFLYAARVLDRTLVSYSRLVGLVRDFLTAPEPDILSEIVDTANSVRTICNENGMLEHIEQIQTGLLTGDIPEIKTPSTEDPRIMVVGGMVEPQAIVSLFDNLDGVTSDIIALDLLSFGFKTVFTPATPYNEDPFLDMANSILKAPLEPTHEGLQVRVRFLKQLLQGLHIDGVVICEQSFCDPDEFESPSHEKVSQDVGVSSLRLPLDPELSDRNRLEGRLQTFMETLQEVG
ncbi:MAG: 2-hydroxyacyl-CoA dehydratase [Candidatus Thorarchaeota archaeon]